MNYYLLLGGVWRSLLAENKKLRPYVRHAISIKDEDALRAVSIVMNDRRWKDVLDEYRSKVNIWDGASELLDYGGAHATEETAERMNRTYELLKAMDHWVLDKGPDPFHGYHSRPHS